MPRAPTGPDKKGDDEWDEESSGWGWLADDIYAGRSGKINDDDPDGSDRTMNEQDRLDQKRFVTGSRMDGGGVDTKQEGMPVYFLDTAFAREREDRPILSTALRQDERDAAETSASRSRDDLDEEKPRYERSERTESPLAYRDPFPLTENSPRWLTQTPTAESVFGRRDGLEASGEGAAGLSTRAEEPPAMASFNMNQPGATGPGSVSSLSGYQSGSMFQRDVGYSPSGLSPVSSEGMFFGGSSFDVSGGLGASFSPAPAMGSAFNVPSTMPVAAPSAGIPGGQERSGPSALPARLRSAGTIRPAAPAARGAALR
jgi:hypothetical protein